MDKTSKLCIICCHPFSVDNQHQNKVKISKFCEEICKSDLRGAVVSSVLNCQHDIIQLEYNFGMSVCPSCLIVINELLTSKENATLLDNHVIFLQKQIIQGLRDLEECLKKVKGHQDRIAETVKASDGLRLKNKFISQLSDDGKAEESKNFVFKVRQCIRKDKYIKIRYQNNENGLKGSLSITDLNEPEHQPEQDNYNILIKVEQEDGNDNQEIFGDDVTPAKLSEEDDEDYSPTLGNSDKQFKKKTPQDQFQVVTVANSKKKRTVSKRSSNNITNLAKEGKRYICKLCDGKVYTNRLSYKRHLNFHQGEKKYKCEYCPRAFFRGDYLKDHLRTHTGEKPFICDVCGRGFTQCVTMNKHKKNVHNR